MTIRVTCGSCQKLLNVKDEYAGKTGKCPQCGTAIAIPGKKPIAEIADPAKTSAKPKPVVGASSKRVENPPATPDPAVSAKSNTRTNPPALLPTDEQVNIETRGNTEHPATTDKRPKIDIQPISATAAKDPSQLMREILGAFHGEFPRVKPTLGYRLAALFVTFFMVLLPMVYVALIGLVGYLLYWHASNNHTVFSAVRGRNAGKGAVLIYLGPIVIGGLLILFMIKPLFARQAKRQEELELSFGEEPILHSFVQRLCEAVNAPLPTLIEVDCEVNAAAYFRHGWWGFLTNDLALRIGLPLLSSLNTRQLAGVLAHELGHFSQGAGMRLSYIIRNVNLWFARVIYERDEWDESIAEWCRDENGWIVVLAGLTSLLVWLTRRVLWCLMIIGHAVSCILLRQMEYDADKFEGRLAGSEVFESTARRLTELNVANSITHQLVVSNHHHAGLPDNLPLCLSEIASTLPQETTTITEKIIEEGKTGWFDSHPADRDRIAAAHRQQAPGIFQMERPAAVLLRDHAKLAENSTYKFYKRFMGKTAVKQQLTPTRLFLSAIGSGAVADS